MVTQTEYHTLSWRSFFICFVDSLYSTTFQWSSYWMFLGDSLYGAATQKWVQFFCKEFFHSIFYLPHIMFQTQYNSVTGGRVIHKAFLKYRHDIMHDWICKKCFTSPPDENHSRLRACSTMLSGIVLALCHNDCIHAAFGMGKLLRKSGMAPYFMAAYLQVTCTSVIAQFCGNIMFQSP